MRKVGGEQPGWVYANRRVTVTRTTTLYNHAELKSISQKDGPATEAADHTRPVGSQKQEPEAIVGTTTGQLNSKKKSN